MARATRIALDLALATGKSLKPALGIIWRYAKVECIPPMTHGFFNGPIGKKLEDTVSTAAENAIAGIANKIRDIDAEEERVRKEKEAEIKAAQDRVIAETAKKVKEAKIKALEAQKIKENEAAAKKAEEDKKAQSVMAEKKPETPEKPTQKSNPKKKPIKSNRRKKIRS